MNGNAFLNFRSSHATQTWIPFLGTSGGSSHFSIQLEFLENIPTFLEASALYLPLCASANPSTAFSLHFGDAEASLPSPLVLRGMKWADKLLLLLQLGLFSFNKGLELVFTTPLACVEASNPVCAELGAHTSKCLSVSDPFCLPWCCRILFLASH